MVVCFVVIGDYHCLSFLFIMIMIIGMGRGSWGLLSFSSIFRDYQNLMEEEILN